jgi:hypothetical protein
MERVLIVVLAGVFLGFSPQQKDPIEKGIKYILKKQRRSGRWDGWWGSQSADLTLTSLCGLALLASGSTHKEGKYSTKIAKALRFLLKEATRSRRGDRAHMNCQRPFVLLFLSQIYRIDPQRKIKKVAEKIIKRLKRNQYKDGGWCYWEKASSSKLSDPIRPGYTLLAMTHSILTSLIAAKYAGFSVPEEMIKKAVKFCERCANKDGGFKYLLKYDRRIYGRSDPGRTGGVICALGLAKPDSEVLKPGIRYFKRKMGRFIRDHHQEHYWFNILFSALGILRIEDLRKEWEERMKKKLLKLQTKRGYWRCTYAFTRGFDIFSTAIALIVLQLPEGKLSLFEERG